MDPRTNLWNFSKKIWELAPQTFQQPVYLFFFTLHLFQKLYLVGKKKQKQPRFLKFWIDLNYEATICALFCGFSFRLTLDFLFPYLLTYSSSPYIFFSKFLNITVSCWLDVFCHQVVTWNLFFVMKLPPFFKT